MKNVLLLLVLGLCFACEDKGEDEVPATVSATDLEIVTGINIRDENGVPLNTFGNPNTKIGNIFFFPNPAQGQALITADVGIANIWIIPADQNTDFSSENFATLFQNFQYEEAKLTEKAVRTFPANNSTGFALQLSDFATGYYRIVYRMEGGNLQWDNIYIHGQSTFAKAVEQLNDDWK